MKYALYFVLPCFIMSCVQKSTTKTIVVTLKINGISNIQSVGIRGKGKPLSWNKDIILQPLIRDSLYTTTFSTLTGYKFTEVKFTVNGEIEFPQKENRKLIFNNTDTTYYEATYNVIN